eukprot:74222-Chlamydomonas_euryale.AAC.4
MAVLCKLQALQPHVQPHVIWALPPREAGCRRRLKHERDGWLPRLKPPVAHDSPMLESDSCLQHLRPPKGYDSTRLDRPHEGNSCCGV